eukprot:scaffold798_cov367-Pavlova_lutheri.AAC.27
MNVFQSWHRLKHTMLFCEACGCPLTRDGQTLFDIRHDFPTLKTPLLTRDALSLLAKAGLDLLRRPLVGKLNTMHGFLDRKRRKLKCSISSRWCKSRACSTMNYRTLVCVLIRRIVSDPFNVPPFSATSIIPSTCPVGFGPLGSRGRVRPDQFGMEVSSRAPTPSIHRSSSGLP